MNSRQQLVTHYVLFLRCCPRTTVGTWNFFARGNNQCTIVVDSINNNISMDFVILWMTDRVYGKT